MSVVASTPGLPTSLSGRIAIGTLALVAGSCFVYAAFDMFAALGSPRSFKDLAARGFIGSIFTTGFITAALFLLWAIATPAWVARTLDTQRRVCALVGGLYVACVSLLFVVVAMWAQIWVVAGISTAFFLLGAFILYWALRPLWPQEDVRAIDVAHPEYSPPSDRPNC